MLRTPLRSFPFLVYIQTTYWWGSRCALDIEKHSVAVSFAGILVSNGIRGAPTFERYRVGNVQRLYRRPFSFPRNPNHLAKGAVGFCIYLSARADLGQATPDSIRPVCSSTS
jgi:hypothetical protein